MSTTIEVKNFRLTKEEQQAIQSGETNGTSVMAQCDVNYNNCITIKGIRLMKGEKGPFISMPRYKTKEDGKEVWKDIVYLSTEEERNVLLEEIAEKYRSAAFDRLESGNDVNVRVTVLNGREDNLRGLATVTVEGLVIRNVKVMDGEKGLFVSMPQYRTTDEDGREQWKSLVYPHNKNMYERLTKQVLEEYNRGSKEREQQGKDIPKNRGNTTR